MTRKVTIKEILENPSKVFIIQITEEATSILAKAGYRYSEIYEKELLTIISRYTHYYIHTYYDDSPQAVFIDIHTKPDHILNSMRYYREKWNVNIEEVILISEDKPPKPESYNRFDYVNLD